MNSASRPLDYKRLPSPKMGQLTALQNNVIKPQTMKFATPKTPQDIAQGRNNAQDISKLPPTTKLY